jgi:hypothetical protein
MNTNTSHSAIRLSPFSIFRVGHQDGSSGRSMGAFRRHTPIRSADAGTFGRRKWQGWSLLARCELVFGIEACPDAKGLW